MPKWSKNNIFIFENAQMEWLTIYAFESRISVIKKQNRSYFQKI
jgi:hypothetical protein